MEIPLVILSHKRAGRVTTHKAISNTLLCVPESQADEYAKFHDPKKFIVHPDSVIGGPNKRQWCLENVGSIFFLDDDIAAMARTWRPKKSKKRASFTPQRAYEVVQRTAETAQQFGAYLFGFNNHVNPVTYHPNKPFRFGGYITGGAMGVFKGSKIYHPDTTLPLADFWVCLINAYYHRYSFIDTRFSFGFDGTYTAVGGTSEFRKEETEQEAFDFLKQHFGRAVQVGTNKSGATTRQMNRAKRRIELPYAT